MTEGNGAAIGVDAWRRRQQVPNSDAGQAVRCERLVQLDDLHVFKAKPGFGQSSCRSFDGANAHDARRHTNHCRGHDSRERLQALGLQPLFIRQEQGGCYRRSSRWHSLP